MTQELLNQLKELDTVFQNRSTEVCELLSPINDDYSHLTEFRLHRDFVDGVPLDIGIVKTFCFPTIDRIRPPRRPFDHGQSIRFFKIQNGIKSFYVIHK